MSGYYGSAVNPLTVLDWPAKTSLAFKSQLTDIYCVFLAPQVSPEHCTWHMAYGIWKHATTLLSQTPMSLT